MNPCPKCGAPVAPEENLRFCPNCLYNAIGDPQSTGTGGHLTSEGWTLGQFGQYELIEVVGKGGMGIVFRARDCTLGRIVALKILRGGALASERDINRFQEEAMLAAALQHPNIVPIFEAGVIDGQPFIAMPYLEGKNLGSMAGQGMSPRRAAEIALRVSEALAHAHSRGIIHRDLKPSNVHVDTHNQVRVLDFGLARRLDGSNELTLTGQILGTPSFMAPEQAMGKSLEIEVRTDVYGIGATLFFLLTGHPPFEADNVASTLHAVMFDDPKPIQAWNPSLDGDLATVVMKCLHKERHQRYPTADALAEDLRRYIGGEPVSARPLDNWQVLKRWSKRNKPIAVTIATVFIALILGVAATVNAFNSNRMQSQAELFNYVAGVSGAYGAWRSGNTGHALDLLRAQIAVDESRDIRSLDWGILRALCEGQEDRLIDLGIGPLRDISVDPSGTRFAVTGTSNLFIGTLAMAGPAKTLPLPFERYNRRIHWHPNGESLFLSQTNGILQVWIDDSRSTLWETGPCTHFAVSPDGTRIAHCSVPLQAGNDPVPLLVWDFTRSAHIATNAGLGGPVTKWSPDSSSLLGVDREGQLIHWNPDLASSRIVIPGNGENKTAALSPSTHWLARAHWGGQIGINSTTNPIPAGNPGEGFGGYLPGRPRNTGLAFTDDNQWFAHLATDHRIHFAQFDPTTQRWHDQFHRSGHTREVTALSPIPGRQAIVSCSEDGTVRVWDCRPTKPLPNLSSQLTNVVGIRAPLISHDGVWAALLVDFPNSNVLWNLRTGEVQPPFLGEAVAFSKEHELLIRTPEDFLEFRPLNGRATNHHVRLPIQSSVEPWQASPDTRWIGLLDSTNQLVFVDWKQPAVTRTFGQANTFEFLPDSRRVIVSLPTEEILLIEIDSLSSKRISTVNSEKIAVSPDGTLVALGTWEHHIDIVEIETGKLQGSLLGHQAGILSLSFSPDNRTLVSTGEDKTIRFWNLKTMRQTSEYPQSQTVRWLTCSPDSSGLLVGKYLRYEFWKCSFSAQ